MWFGIGKNVLGKKYDQNINVPNNYSRTVKMCSLYTEGAWSRNRKWTASAHSNVISIPCILIARKLYTILECLRERDTHVAGVGGNGQKLRESGLKKTLGCASTHTCYPISTPIISAVSFCLWQHISDNFWNSAIKFISNLIQALSRTYVCFQVLSRPWIHMSEIQVLSSTFKKRGNPANTKY